LTLIDLQNPTATPSTSRDPFELERLVDELEAHEHSIDTVHDLPSIPPAVRAALGRHGRGQRSKKKNTEFDLFIFELEGLILHADILRKICRDNELDCTGNIDLQFWGLVPQNNFI
jgi:hypothetical protein